MEYDKTPELPHEVMDMLSIWDEETDIDYYYQQIVEANAEDDFDRCAEVVTELEEILVGQYRPSECITSGRMFKLEDDGKVQEWNIEAFKDKKLQYDGLQISWIDDKINIVFGFTDVDRIFASDSDGNAEEYAFVARREDLEKLDIIRDDVDYVRRYDTPESLNATAVNLMKSAEYQQATHELQAEMLREELDSIKGRLVAQWGDGQLMVETDFYYHLNKNSQDPIEWNSDTVRYDIRKSKDVDDGFMVQGQFRGVVVPADHPACADHTNIPRRDVELWNSVHAVFDDEELHVAYLVPITFIDTVEPVYPDIYPDM